MGFVSNPAGWSSERLDVIWGLKQPPSRGPKPALTVEQIVEVGIELADAEGLEAVSMKRISDRLGVGAMTLYTYVPDKATLLMAMLDTVFGKTDLPDSRHEWRDYLMQAAEAILQTYLLHPWGLEVVADGPPISPNQMRFLETTMEVLDRLNLTDREKIDIAMTISYFVRGAADIGGGILRAERASGLSREEVGALQQESLMRVLDPEVFPLTLRVLTGPPEDSPTESEWDDFGFRFGLDRLLDGIEALIATRE